MYGILVYRRVYIFQFSFSLNLFNSNKRESHHVEFSSEVSILHQKLRLVGYFAITSWKWDNISYISQAGGEQNHKIKHKTESGVLDCSMPAKIQVPFILLFSQPQFLNPAPTIYSKIQFSFHVYDIKNQASGHTIQLHQAGSYQIEIR